MIHNILLLLLYFYLLQKSKQFYKKYELLVKNRSNQTDFYLDYCDEPICF